MENDWISATAAADFIGISRQAVYKLIKADHLRSQRLSERVWLVSGASVRTYLRAKLRKQGVKEGKTPQEAHAAAKADVSSRQHDFRERKYMDQAGESMKRENRKTAKRVPAKAKATTVQDIQDSYRDYNIAAMLAKGMTQEQAEAKFDAWQAGRSKPRQTGPD